MLRPVYKRKSKRIDFFIRDETISTGEYRGAFERAFYHYGIQQYIVYECIGGLIIKLPPDCLDLFEELARIPTVMMQGNKKDYSIRDIFNEYGRSKE